MFRILESQAPAKQNATTTISTLSGRLQSATLLEDRRAAILGLRSFAKLYPASVASGALRSLISCLNKDVEDVDTTKVILETLLMLFNPEESSPEASEDIALWLADEFTQRQDNITVLLDLLDTSDFFSRLYSLQLISAISTARPQRTQECVYTAPLGVSRLVEVLEDKREAIRSEGLLLLTALTPSSSDLQKLVAFENAFERIFRIIDAEGSLTHGGIAVQDCLSLLANLLRLNVSNQSYFRETGFAKTLHEMLREALREQDSSDSVAEWVRPQRDKNVWGLLVVLQLFLIKGSVGTQANQISFWQNGVLTQVLEIAFHRSIDLSVRAEALKTSADLIRGSSGLQESFGQLEVVSPKDEDVAPQVNGHPPAKRPPRRVNILEALLDLALSTSPSNHTFDLRLSACECIKAYMYGHAQIRLFFLRRAIDGYMSDVCEADNILTILIEDPENGHGADPYRRWMASVLLFHLLYEDFEAKNTAMAVKDGDADGGEEVVTCIQALTGNMISAERKGEDERVTIGYLMILCGWLYEDHNGVNDFLGEGSNVQSIVQLVAQDNNSRILVSGLCAFLLGIVYEFSTKDSPIPRETLHQLLTGRLGRELYSDRITRLREHPMVRDFEVLPQGLNSSTPGGLPEVYFDRTFLDFLKDNFSRILRAIDRAPGFEVPVIANGIQKGVSRELVDSLKAQVEDRSQTIQKLESVVANLERKLGQEQADHRKAKESAVIELARIKNINDALQRNHEDELIRIAKEHHSAQLENQKSHESIVLSLNGEVQKSKDSEAARAMIQARTSAEIDGLKFTIRSLGSELSKLNKDHIQDLQTAHEDYSAKIASLESRLERAEDKATDAEARSTRLQAELDNKEDSRKTAQTELDDLLMVLGDLEEKRTRDKKRLRILGEPVSDVEDDGELDGEDGNDDIDGID